MQKTKNSNPMSDFYRCNTQRSFFPYQTHKTGKCMPKIHFFLKSQIFENLLSYGVIFKIQIGDFFPSVKFVNAISIKNIIF